MAARQVEFAHVSFHLPGGHCLLRDISLHVPPGTTTALLGRSGSGKTTLLRTVNGLVRPTAGHVLVGGQDVATANTVTLRRGIGYVIQETGLFPHMKVDRNIALALELEGRPLDQRRARAAEMLRLVGLPEALSSRYPWQLSGGQRQRVGLARALAAQPGVFLMDEPFGALDPLTRAEMQDMLRDLLQRVETTTLIVTHDLQEALYLADQVVFIDSGSIVGNLKASEVLNSKTEAIQRYVAATTRTPKPAPGGIA